MENVPVLLLGNKSDHVERHVTTEEGQNVAKVCIWFSAATPAPREETNISAIVIYPLIRS